MRKCGHCGLDRDESEFNLTHRWCRSCRRDYSRTHRPHDSKFRVIPATRDLEVLPITMVYQDVKGGMLCGHCKERLHFIGTTEVRGGKEIRFWCLHCLEAVIVPAEILPRIQVWRCSPVPVDRDLWSVLSGSKILASGSPDV